MIDSDLSAEITRSLFNTAREYIESFDVYGSKKSYEWQQTENEDPVVFDGEVASHVKIPDYAHLLPESIRQFTTKGVYDLKENEHLSFKQGSGHGGSHPHLAHEFVIAIVEDRDPFPNAVQSANWTSIPPGLNRSSAFRTSGYGEDGWSTCRVTTAAILYRKKTPARSPVTFTTAAGGAPLSKQAGTTSNFSNQALSGGRIIGSGRLSRGQCWASPFTFSLV